VGNEALPVYYRKCLLLKKLDENVYDNLTLDIVYDVMLLADVG
jgi:hypothetical protein